MDVIKKNVAIMCNAASTQAAKAKAAKDLGNFSEGSDEGDIKIREAGGSPSVALNPHTPAEMIENVLDLVDHVLVMTVNPGFGGQAYIPTMTDKIRKIRKWGDDRGLDFDIEVDGGVKADWTIAACAEAGANCFIAGSGMFKYDDLSVGCSELRTIAEAAQKGKVLKEGQTIKDL